MMPAYRSMGSYPYQRNQRPFHHCYHPGIEAIPPQMKMDPSKPPFSLDQHWPYAEHSMLPHFCCGHNYNPGYYSYKPSYYHAPAPMYYSEGCPTYGEPFFVPYSPQPHYTMELPRYEYDKYMPHDHHCCGCPNHQCNPKEDKSLKIKEHEPDGGKKVTDASVQIQFKNYPYPLIWVPPEYTCNKQLKNPSLDERTEQDKISHDRKPPSPENFNADAQPTQEPRVWNGWLPFDIKGAPNMFHGGHGIRKQNQEIENNRRESDDGKMDQKHQSEHKRSEFPFPIFWLPYYNKQEESGKTNNQEDTSSPKIIEEVPYTFKSVPVKSHVDEDVINGTRSNQVESTNTGALDDAKKVSSARSIPVKQIELHQGKNDSEKSDKLEINVSPSQVQENVTQKDSCTGGQKRESSSSPKAKASKLPPVCLRVDPLPRKKNGNGRSRSLSPSSSKEHFQAMAGETSKTPLHCTNDNKVQSNCNFQNAANTSEKVGPKVRTIHVCENKTSENKGADNRDGCQSQIEVNMPSEVPTWTKETCMDGEKYMIEDEKAKKVSENMMEETTEPKEVKDSNAPTDKGREEGRFLSDADAAILIQAAYRGHQVRKWEPLKKLKQIEEVNKEVTVIRGRVEAFESSSDLQNDDKEKIAIGETIMRVLLKLDTIQGLHPSLREIRKSLARELTTLQERLDFIMAKKPQQQMHDLVVEKLVEVKPQNMQNEEYVQEKQKEKVDVSRDSCEGIRDGLRSPAANDDAIESQSPVDTTSNDGSSNEGREPIVPPNDDALNSTSDASEPDKMPVELEVKSEVNHIPIEVDKLDTTIWEELPVGVVDEDINDVSTAEDEHDDSPHDMSDSEIHAMTELPVGLLDEDGETNNSKGKAQTENGEWIEEFPVRLFDEDAPKSEAETHEEVLPTEERVCNADKKTQQEHSQVEDKEEVQSSGESDGWVKIEFQNENEFKEHDTNLPSLTTQVSDQQLGKRDACLEAKDVNNMLPEPIEFVPINDLQKEQEEPTVKVMHVRK